MKSYKLIPLALMLLTLSVEAKAATKNKNNKVTCPVVASKSGKAFESLSSREFICFRNISAARAAGYTPGGKIFVSSKFHAEDSFSLDGSGDSNSPVFQVTSHSALITYSFSGAGNFLISLINQTTGSVVDRLVSTRGSVSSSTYVNTPGLFYLKISSTSSKADEGSATWSVSLESNAL